MILFRNSWVWWTFYYGCHFKTAIFNLVLLIGFFRSSNDNAPRWMPWDFTDDKSTLVQVMAWCHQATSHYPSQCWPSPMLPYGATRPQWVNMFQLNWNVLQKLWFNLCVVDPNAQWIIHSSQSFKFFNQVNGCQVVRYKKFNTQRGMRFRRISLAHLTHWGQVTHICVSKLTIICLDNGL